MSFGATGPLIGAPTVRPKKNGNKSDDVPITALWGKALGKLAEDSSLCDDDGFDGSEEDVQQHLQALNFFEEQKKQAELIQSHPSYASIPVFFKPKTKLKDIDPDSPKGQLVTLAQKRILEERSNLAWDSQVLQVLWEQLQEHGIAVDMTDDDPTYTLDYKGYAAVRDELMTMKELEIPVALQPFLTNAAFFRLPKDGNGRILISSFFNYMLKKVTLYQTRIDLMLYDSNGTGMLQETDLQRYLYELIPSLPALAPLPENFYRYYVCAAVRKFFFFLDTQKRGEIEIDAIVQSPIMAEFCQMTTASENEECSGNWFSASTYAKIYDHYVTLDEDRNGMLSRSELYKYDEGTYTQLFLDRIFQVSHTFKGEMDYKKYIDFVLAVKNKDTKPAFDVLWKVFDVYDQGYLSERVVGLFYKDIQKKYIQNKMQPVRAEDALTEIFDMVKPAIPLKIYKKDLERCKNRSIVCSILTNWREFWRYDNRESIHSSQNQPPEDEVKYKKLCSEIEIVPPRLPIE